MSKNGYTIRTELLSVAVNILESQQRVRRENEMIKPKDSQLPVDGYSAEDVVACAETLNRFISQTMMTRQGKPFTINDL